MIGTVSSAAVIPHQPELERLGKQHKMARIRYWLLLLIPLLWVFGILVAWWINNDTLWEGIAIWLVLVLFVVGGWVFAIIPSKDATERKYTSLVLPALLSKSGISAEYSSSHALTISAFLKSGLYQERYSTLLREDSITGNYGGMAFGMYQVAVQIASGGRTRIYTNHFYGWVIQCATKPIAGCHVLLLRNRKTSHESDDWLAPVQKYWQTNPECPGLLSGNTVFDEHFLVFSDRPKIAAEIFHPQVREFLLYLAQSSENAFGISIAGNILTIHIGHISPNFRSCPEKDFAHSLHPKMILEVKWYTDLLKGIKRSFA